MNERILIVEDEFIVAHDLEMILCNAGYLITGIAGSVKAALEILENNTVDMVLLDIFLKGRQTGIDLAKILAYKRIPFIYISANSNEKVMEAAKSTAPYGFIVKPYRDKDVLLSIDIARYRNEHSLYLKESSKSFMEDFIHDISLKPLSWERKMLLISGAFQAYIPFDFLGITGITKDNVRFSEIGISRKNFSEYDIFFVEEIIKKTGITGDFIYTGDSFQTLISQEPVIKMLTDTYGLKCSLVKLIRLDNGDVMLLSFYSKIEQIFKPEHLDLLNLLEATLAKNLDHVIELEKSDLIKLQPGSTIKKKILPTPVKFQNIIGQSASLLNLLNQVSIVAPTDTAVLVTGESGTGKELIAQHLHLLSTRANGPFVTVNCAALPADLIESILFGHEKGSFTDAMTQRIGKFEEATGGTIFLDEIGEMPMDLQSKLLRVLQEKEIERIGGSKAIAVDLRIVAATNLNLEKEIAQGNFRLDLYYRLKVFPLEVPALRNRKDDIPILAAFFLEKHAKALGKSIPVMTAESLAKLLQYDWPGNIRQLDHAILRAILLSKDGVIDQDLLDINTPDNSSASAGETKTIFENEREHIIQVLNLCKGQISGQGGAASLLGVPATTLSSKMKKLGIKR